MSAGDALAPVSEAFEVVRTLEVDIQLDELFTVRVELLQSVLNPSKYRFHLWRQELYDLHINSFTPESNPELSEDSRNSLEDGLASESLLVAWDSFVRDAPSEVSAESPSAAMSAVMKLFEASVTYARGR